MGGGRKKKNGARLERKSSLGGVVDLMFGVVFFNLGGHQYVGMTSQQDVRKPFSRLGGGEMDMFLFACQLK